MINLRYHIISLTAVFLALGIGITLGSTFLDRFTVDNLQRQLTTVEAQVRETRSENSALGDRVDELDRRDALLAEQLPERILAGHLAEIPVLVLTTDDTDDRLLQRAMAALSGSGAGVAGTWSVSDRWALEEDRQQADLAEALGLSGGTPDRLRRSATVRLADLLLAAARPEADDGEDPDDPDADDPTGDETDGDDPAGDEVEAGAGAAVPGSEPDVVAALRRAGFLDYTPMPGAEDDRVLVPGADVRIVVVADDSPGSPSGDFLIGLIAELATDGVAPVVVAQGLPSPDEDVDQDEARTTFVGQLRADEGIGARVSTVDDLETTAGLLALVLAVEDLGAASVGHYGLGPGAGRLLPAPPPS